MWIIALVLASFTGATLFSLLRVIREAESGEALDSGPLSETPFAETTSPRRISRRRPSAHTMCSSEIFFHPPTQEATAVRPS